LGFAALTANRDFLTPTILPGVWPSPDSVPFSLWRGNDGEHGDALLALRAGIDQQPAVGEIGKELGKGSIGNFL